VRGALTFNELHGFWACSLASTPNTAFSKRE